MIVYLSAIYLVGSFYWTRANSFVFEDEGRRYHAPVQQDSSVSARKGLGSHFNPTAISNILNIPATLIQTTSAAAQSFAPNNADMINKVFDIPVQVLQAIGDVVKDVTPPSVDGETFMNRRDERLQRLMKIRQQQQQQQELQSLQDQQQQNENHTTRRRHILGGFGWASAFTDLFFGGHGSLFERDKFFFGQQGTRQGHKKRKKKNKHGLFGSHGQGNNEDQQIFNNDKDIFQVYNDIHDILPNGLFSWNPTRQSDRIQNKIAPGFADQSRTIY